MLCRDCTWTCQCLETSFIARTGGGGASGIWEIEARVAVKWDSPTKNYLAQMLSAELRSPVALVPVGSADLILV